MIIYLLLERSIKLRDWVCYYRPLPQHRRQLFRGQANEKLENEKPHQKNRLILDVCVKVFKRTIFATVWQQVRDLVVNLAFCGGTHISKGVTFKKYRYI